MFRGIFIDDRDNDSHLAANLSIDQGVDVVFLKADKEMVQLATTVLDSAPDVVALDYRLDEQQSAIPVRYKAGPLAQYLRDNALEKPDKDFPIILVSAEENIQQYFKPDHTSHDLFDRVYSKQDVVKDTQRVQRELLALINGYKDLIENWSSENRLIEVMCADERAASEFAAQEIRNWNDLRAPHLLAREVLRTIIDRVGLLLDRRSLVAILGVSDKSPDFENLLKVFSDCCEYRGIFALGWNRWWTHAAVDFARKTLGQDIGNLSAEERAAGLSERLELKLEPALSRWTDRADFYPGFACASCGQPTERERSVAAYDHVPSFIQKRRICWQCISTGEYEQLARDLQIDDNDEYIVEKLRNGEIKKGS